MPMSFGLGRVPMVEIEPPPLRDIEGGRSAQTGAASASSLTPIGLPAPTAPRRNRLAGDTQARVQADGRPIAHCPLVEVDGAGLFPWPAAAASALASAVWAARAACGGG